ncbi:MAG TPA: diguanylate cyclase [Burkholderiaceae bacterium]
MSGILPAHRVVALHPPRRPPTPTYELSSNNKPLYLPKKIDKHIIVSIAIRLTSEGTIRFTVSIGITVLEERHTNCEVLLKDADSAMYQAKREGRNRIVFAGS